MAGEPDDDSMFSRSGSSSADGKLDQHLNVVLSQQMLDDLIGVAFAHGKSKSEYAREVLEAHLYGMKVAIQRKVSGRFADDDGRKVA